MLGATLVAASCGKKAGTVRLTAVEVVDATHAANTARTETTMQIRVGKNVGSAEISGRVDFSQPRGDEVVRVAPSSSTPSHVNGATGEKRWIGNQIFLRGSDLFPNTPGWAFIDATKVRQASPCLAKVDIVSLAGGSAPSPGDFLDTLRQEGTTLQRVGTDNIGGVDTTHWRVPRSKLPTFGCSNSHRFRLTVHGTSDLWTDQDNRARQIEITEDETTAYTHPPRPIPAFDTSLTIKIDYSDFGAPVTVQPPPPDQVKDRTAAFIAQWLGTTTNKP